MKKTALLSVFNKTDAFANFASALSTRYGFNLLASSGTVKFLAERGVSAQDVADIVGPPILGHRVVTLSREVYAAILARTWDDADSAELERLNLSPINLVYVDMYPLADAIRDPDKDAAALVEMIDIGGPTMLRASNKAGRISVSHESQFQDALNVLDMEKSGGQAHARRLRLQAQAERQVAGYVDLAASFYEQLANGTLEDWRQTFRAAA